MTVTDAAPAVPLSTLMRDGSRPQHEAAESSVFVFELMAGRVSAAGYVNFLRSLRAIYAALEETGRAVAGDPVVGGIVDARLERVAAIDADLAFWSTGEAAESLVAGASAAEYAAAIRATVADPVRYVAHHYTRYLGDLSGGQVIGRLLEREFALEGQGTALYEFAEIAKVKPYKDDYRARLDSLDLTEDQREAVVTEVQRSFSFNQAMFAELAAQLDAFAR